MTISGEEITITERHMGEHPVLVRIYRPEASDAVLVFAHGGGFSWGTLDDYDQICRNLALGAKSTVVSIAYRLAPEHPFPAGLDDVHAVASRILTGEEEGLEGTRVILAGDSAGAGLAAGLAQRLRDEGVTKASGQLLIYPMLQYHDQTPAGFHTLADRFHPSFPVLTRAWDIYVRREGGVLPCYASPPRTENLAGLPPALVITAENDPLRFEAIEYAEALRADGVGVMIRDFEGVEHGFLNEQPSRLEAVPRALDAIRTWIGGLPR